MRVAELLESQAEQDLRETLLRAQQHCKVLERRFSELLRQRGYEDARASVFASIPNVEHMRFYIELVSKTNPKLTKTYATTRLMIKQLVDRINSGV